MYGERSVCLTGMVILRMNRSLLSTQFFTEVILLRKLTVRSGHVFGKFAYPLYDVDDMSFQLQNVWRQGV